VKDQYHVRHEQVQFYLPRDIVAWFAMQTQGKSAVAEEVMANWIVDQEYETIKARYCKGMTDLEILRLSHGEVAEAAQDDDIELVWRVLQGGSKKAVEAGEGPRLVGTLQVALCASRMPVYVDPTMGPDEYKLVAGKNRVPWEAMRESIPEIPDNSMKKSV
jgi:hypothetical protein